MQLPVAVLLIIASSIAQLAFSLDEKTTSQDKRDQRRLKQIEVKGNIHRFRAAPNNWMTVTPYSLQTLFLSKVFVIFPHEPASFDDNIWKNVLAVGLKKHVQFADVLLADRHEHTGVGVVDMIFEAMPSRLRPKNIHCIGVGFGSQLCALLGKRYADEHGDGLGRITACDPLDEELSEETTDLAAPLDFEYVDVASFVDVLHTSFIGTKKLIGDVDVFVNSAIVQPECLPLNLATEIINVCHQRNLDCPPMEELHSCAFSNECPKGLISELDDTVKNAPVFDVESDLSYRRDVRQLFRPSQERAVLLFAAALEPYLNCPVCKPILEITMCPCDEEVLAQNIYECPKVCKNPENFGLKINTTITGTFHITTTGFWPYFTCVQDPNANVTTVEDTKAMGENGSTSSPISTSKSTVTVRKAVKPAKLKKSSS